MCMSMLHVYHSRIPLRLVKGKPSVVVSANGISNGLSDTYNDGADFGPDTLLGATEPGQYGPPYTQTTGIQEALNYAGQIAAAVELGPGYFPVSAAILIPDVWGFSLRGASNQRTTVYQAPGFTGTIMEWANPSASNNIFYIGHMRFYGPNGGSGWLVDLHQNIEDSYHGLLENLYIEHNGIGGLELDGNEDTILIGLTFENDGSGAVGIGWNIPYGGGWDFGGKWATGAYLTAQQFNFVGTVFGSEGLLNLSPIPDFPAKYNFFGCYWNCYNSPGNNWPATISVNGNSASGIVNTLYLNFFGGALFSYCGQSSTLPIINLANSTPLTVYAKFIGVSIPTSKQLNLFGSTGGGTITGYAEFDDLTGPLANVNVNNAPVSTPAVPASGTAQANGNSFPITVYLSGGSATQVQVTKYGNTYTVWSASTATAIPPLTIRLNPGDSITLTYSTAPAWTWVPA